MLEVGIAPGANRFEVWGISKQLVTGSNVDRIRIEGDTAQSPISTAATPIYINRVPVELLFEALIVEINQVNAAMAFTLATPTNNRCC